MNANAVSYHIDYINGSNTNDGLTPQTAFKTAQKLFGRPADPGEIHPDVSPLPGYGPNTCNILFKKNQTHPYILNINRGGISPQQTIYFGTYGSETDESAMPKIHGFFGQADSLNYITAEGLHFTNDVKYSNNGVSWKAAGQEITFVNCKFSGLKHGWAIEHPDGVEGGFLKKFKFKNCKVSDCKSTNSHSQGGYQQGFEDLEIENCVFHDVGNVNSMFDHGLYMHGGSISALVRNCIVSNGANVGIQCRGGRYNIFNNLIMKCAFGITFGSGTNKKQCAGEILDNVVLYGRDLGPDPISCGIAIAMNADGTNVGRNIVAYKKGNGTFGALSYGNEEAFEYTSLINSGVRQRKSGKAMFYDNFVIDWTPCVKLTEYTVGTGFTGNYYMVRAAGTILTLKNSQNWSNLSQRQFILPEQYADMAALNNWWAPEEKWKIKLEGWDHQPIDIDPKKVAILDPGGYQDGTWIDDMPDISIERYLQEFVNLPIAECTYDRFITEALKINNPTWATAGSYNSWARLKIGL